jgi:hypothetical protein
VHIYFKENLAMLAVPKTGSTAYEMALKRRADIIFQGRRKHMTAGQFSRRFAPFLKEMYDLTPERMAVIRDPLEHMRSWYRYRLRDGLEGSKNSTQGLSFDDFVLAAIAKSPPPHARVGSQGSFLGLRNGATPLHHIFAYEAQPVLRGFLEERFRRKLKLKEVNVSPPAPAPISPEVETRLRAARAADFDLHDRVIQAGGHLHQLLD